MSYCTRRKIESWFSLFFLPLFPREVLAEYLKCDVCRHSFELPALRPFLPSGGYLPSDLRAELLAGAPIEAVEGRLIASGVDRESARLAIDALAGDRRRGRPPCGLTFLEGVPACQVCGRQLAKGKNKAGPELEDFA
jgi:hypothetical protein